MLNIIKIEEHEDLGKFVQLEGYPNTQPVVPSNLVTHEEIIAYLNEPHWNGQSWQQTQDEIDLINKGLASPEVIAKHSPKIPFNADLAIHRQSEVFPIERMIALSPYAYTINEFIKKENWTKLREFIEGLINATVATQQDKDNLALILSEQGIVL